jgi:uncharacterized membrane protein YvbJ
MSLVTCPDCGKQVSEQAPSCIHCGRPLKADLVKNPSAGSAEAVKKGDQRSKLRTDLGGAIAFVGLLIAIVVGMVGSAMAGWLLALAVLGLAIWVTYGS